jgi:hypothetical protein
MTIIWTDRVGNEELHRVKEDRNSLRAMKLIKSSRIGHILSTNRLLNTFFKERNKRREDDEEDVSRCCMTFKNRY